MANLNRLPKGYLARVKDVKAHLTKALNNLNKATTFNEQLTALVNNYHTSQRYQDDSKNLHISFDFGIVSSEFIYNRLKCKWELWKICTVFIDDSEDFVDNYKW